MCVYISIYLSICVCVCVCVLILVLYLTCPRIFCKLNFLAKNFIHPSTKFKNVVCIFYLISESISDIIYKCKERDSLIQLIIIQFGILIY